MDASHMSHMNPMHSMNTMMGGMGAAAKHMSARGIPGGVGGNLNVDVGGGFGGGFPGLLGGGFPGWGGSPYIPITPLGALGGIKGDLLVPIVAIGVALFLLVIIVLAVKMALAWKLSVLDDLTNGPKKWRRDIGSGAAPQLDNDYMIQLAKVVTSAIYSGSCSDRMICEVGAFARGNADQLDSIVRLVESFIPASYHSSLDILRTSAKGTFDCGQQYQCGSGSSSSKHEQDQPGSSNSTIPAASSPANPQQQQQQQQQPQQQQQQPPRPTGLFGINANEIKQGAQVKPNKFKRNI